MAKIFFSIILPTFNRVNTIKKIILPSIEKQDFTNYEFILIDDCSTDQTFDYFSSDKFKHEFPNISSRLKLIKNITNIGSPASRNVGFEHAVGEWVFMVEDDLEIRNSNFLSKTFESINSYLKFNPEIAVFSPKREEGLSKGYYKNFNGNLINYGFISKEVYLDPDVEFSGFVENTHACSFIKTEIAKKIKYDSVSYSYFREESDFYERIKIGGGKIFYLGDILTTYHRMDLVTSGGNRKHSVSIQNEIKYIKSHYIFLKKYFHFAEIRILFFIFVRGMKHLTNLTSISFFKDFCSYIIL